MHACSLQAACESDSGHGKRRPRLPNPRRKLQKERGRRQATYNAIPPLPYFVSRRRSAWVALLLGQKHRRVRRCSDPIQPNPRLSAYTWVDEGNRRPARCLVLWWVMEAPLLIRGAHVVRRSGAHPCVSGPDGKLHMPRSIKTLSHRTYLTPCLVLQQKTLGLGLISSGTA